MSFEHIKVLIWGKTYPELSTKHVETVCTGGVRENGTPIRLYPVPLRYLNSPQQFQLYDWIDVPVEKSRSDPRPESFKVVSDQITRVGHLDTEQGTWRSRSELIFRDPAWHFASMGSLKTEEERTGRSMGLVAPGVIENVRLVIKPDQERLDYETKMEEIQSQKDIFRPEYKELEYLPCDIKLEWRCLERCPECGNRPHSMKVLDWGLLELGRREGWPAARDKLGEIADLARNHFRLFMGNFRLHPKTFGIIGLWYPRIRNQLELL